ncbi:DarT ssDNA thymidine ADP-ribosyltransferase family protein [Pedobacter alluvionis]|uniref:DUF4433 domain-containing protein n=1 Tax=Pedobacter alluvionis TaxID=475253 RepID=A0A497XL14_9SPHI|nr:DarT ssDNA thymidine ADP-ribosyltransferase family protein [Pedobacter alluvionis]RLJ69326.1 uncharacterized protein DUF4433 [Pedobacter alluvionis]TFB30300.1 DUF4433 domain-containing protein [Pedobacter alluvionis]
MSLINAVKLRFEGNTNYSQAHQLVYQAKSLKYLSSDLYRDSKRFIYELIQNADDSSVEHAKVKLTIKLFGDVLVVAHTGKPFDERDVRGITGVDDGTKKNAPDKTGFKGIGFKSVFGQSKKVTVFSEGEYFRFDASYEHEWKDDWGESREAWESNEGLEFEMPWQIIPIYTEITDVDPEIDHFLVSGGWKVATIIELNNNTEIKEGIKELASNANMYLFLKNITSLLFETDSSTNIEIIESEEGHTVLKVNGEEKARWQKHLVTLEVPEVTRRKLAEDSNVPEKLKATTRVDITFAAKISEGRLTKLDASERLLYAYLPTEEKNYNIPVLVNAAFYTLASRENLHQESAFNEWLFSSIPYELLKWVAAMVADKKYDAYNILPERLGYTTQLGGFYNTSLDKALIEIPFVVNSKDVLLKRDQAIIDFTGLSRQVFFDGQHIITSVSGNGIRPNIAEAPFFKEIGHKLKLKKAGTASFVWAEVPYVLALPTFATSHTLEKNRQFISHLKDLANNPEIKEVTNDILKSWSFILNHRNELKSPKEVFFPATGETYDDESELSFINPGLQEWLDMAPEIKTWIESLGVVEKSDFTFLAKTVIPNVKTYIKPENAILETRKIFNLYLDGQVTAEMFAELRELRVLTTEGRLIPAKDSFLSSGYKPRLALEQVFAEDIYIDRSYMPEGANAAKWKAFFLALGVNEGIDVVVYEKRLWVSDLVASGIKQAFIDRKEHTYNWLRNDYKTEQMKNISTLTLLPYTERSVGFAKIFWKDVVEFIFVDAISAPAIGYSGKTERGAWINGNEIENYLKWYVSEVACIPTTTVTCLSAQNIFLNDPETLKLCDGYLPVFDGPELNADWRAFFGFRPRLELNDYLLLLEKISQDPGTGNKVRISTIYKYLLDAYSSWSGETVEKVRLWAEAANLFDTKGDYTNTGSLKHYPDGDNAIFGGTYRFIYLDLEAKRHADLGNLLGILGVEILRQDQFTIETSTDLGISSLQAKLESIIPFWAKWMEKERQDGYEQMYFELDSKFKSLQFKEASEIFIVYGADLRRKVPIHFHENILYVSRPWNSPKVMYTLTDRLCEIFGLKKSEKELSLLLRSNIQEISDYFNEEGMEQPPVEQAITANLYEQSGPEIDGETSTDFDHDFGHKPKADYQKQWNESVERNGALKEVYGDNPAEFLIKGLEQFNGGTDPMVYHFSHLDNAVSIIREGAIKSRRDAIFLDSAGSGIIAQTDENRKEFARFYFRSKTPTQFYIENLGRGEESVKKISSDPVCPVPIFFVIPLREAMQQDWNVSVGSLASKQTEFGRDIETLSKFDFEGVYKNMPEIEWQRFRIASHQEFLIKEKLDLTACNFHLVVQDETAKESLLAMLGELATEFCSKILVDPTYYNGLNAKVEIDAQPDSVRASLTMPHNGSFILQHSALDEWEAIEGTVRGQFNNNNWITTFGEKNILFQSCLRGTKYKIFYSYKGRVWLIHTNTEEYGFDLSFAMRGLEEWMGSQEDDIDGLFYALKLQPEFSYWFGRELGGPDGLNLEQHTRKVICNYLQYFKGKQKFFPIEKEYLLCLALHDIGKPVAVAEGNRKLQHVRTLEILERNRKILPISENSYEFMKTIIDADPIGRFLNTTEEFNVSDASKEVLEMQEKLQIALGDFAGSLIIYYQCDAAGYTSLQKRLFLLGEDSSLTISEDGSRLLFNAEYEPKFIELFETIQLLS